MKIWILRYPEPRDRLGVPRDLVVLESSMGDQETELETLRIEFKDAPLHEAVKAQIAQGRTRLVLDLVHEKRMDSSDLAQTLEAYKEAMAAGAELVIANPNPRIREIFRITHFDEAMRLFDSIGEASEHLAS